MSKKSNPTVIGAFVVGAMVLLVAGAALFGGSELLAERSFYVAYFVENAKGLRKGSNVMLNGVRIGRVSGMALIVDQESLESKTEVTMEILPDSYIVTRDGVAVSKGLDVSTQYERLINKGGLRAVLQVESFVTGQLLVELTTRPDTAPVLRGGPNPPYPEIPTVRTEIQELLANLQGWVGDFGRNFDAAKLGSQIQNIVAGIDEIANSQDLRESLAGFNAIISKEDTQELTVTLQATLTEIRSAARDAGSLIRGADAKLETLELKPIAEKLAATLDEATAALTAAKIQLRGESVQFYQLGGTLKEVEGAARSLREFLDYLERHPEAILQGKDK